MASAVSSSGVSASAGESGRGDPARGWRALLSAGVVAGPFYLAVGLIQALTRDGFDLSRHPLSLLASGSGGWVQTVNFLLTGLMVVAAAIGLRRALAPKSSTVSLFLAGFGLMLILAAVFPADPMDGFPPGTPLGVPTSMSSTGMIHFVVGALGFIFLAVSCFAAGRALARLGAGTLGRWSVAAGVTIVVGFFSGAALATTAAGVLGIWLSVVAGWSWLAITCLHVRRLRDVSA